MAIEIEDIFVPEPTLRVEKKSLVRADFVFKVFMGAFALVAVVILVWLGIQLYMSSRLAFTTLGFWNFIKGTTWDPVSGVFGALPFIYGTVLTAFLSLLIATPLGVGTAIFLAELSPNMAEKISPAARRASRRNSERHLWFMGNICFVADNGEHG